MGKGLENEIAYLRDVKTHFWAAFLGSFSGSFGLMFVNISLVVKLPLSIVGFTLSTLFLMNYLKKGDMIEKRINFLKKKGG